MGRVVTAANGAFRAIVSQCMEHAMKRGYAVTVFDLGGLGFGHPLVTDPQDIEKKAFVPCIFKIRALREALKMTPTSHLVWLDADAFLLDRIDEVFTDDYEMGVTERDPWEIARYQHDPRVGSINSGVLFLRRWPGAETFLDEWEQLATACNLEQQALNQLVRQKQVRVKRFPCRIYNNYYFDGRGTPKVIHYKGGYRRRLNLLGEKPCDSTLPAA